MSLLDPTNNEPTTVSLKRTYNPTTKTLELVRISHLSKSQIKVPEIPDPWKDQAGNFFLVFGI